MLLVNGHFECCWIRLVEHWIGHGHGALEFVIRTGRTKCQAQEIVYLLHIALSLPSMPLLEDFEAL